MRAVGLVFALFAASASALLVRPEASTPSLRAPSPALRLRGGSSLVAVPQAPGGSASTNQVLRGGQAGGMDWQLLIYFAFWYLGNY